MRTGLVFARFEQRHVQIAHRLVFFAFTSGQQRIQSAPQPLV